MTTTATLAIPSLALGFRCPSVAYRRSVDLGPEETIVTARSMDGGVETEAFEFLALDNW